MNKELEEITVLANMNIYGELIQAMNPIPMENPIIAKNKKLTNYQINKFRDKIEKELKLKDMFIYFLFYPEPLKFLFVIEFDAPKVLNSKKLGRLLKYIDLYDYKKVKSDNELFLLFDIMENTNFDFKQFQKEKLEFEEVLNNE